MIMIGITIVVLILRLVYRIENWKTEYNSREDSVLERLVIWLADHALQSHSFLRTDCNYTNLCHALAKAPCTPSRIHVYISG